MWSVQSQKETLRSALHSYNSDPNTLRLKCSEVRKTEREVEGNEGRLHVETGHTHLYPTLNSCHHQERRQMTAHSGSNIYY